VRYASPSVIVARYGLVGSRVLWKPTGSFRLPRILPATHFTQQPVAYVAFCPAPFCRVAEDDSRGSSGLPLLRSAGEWLSESPRGSLDKLGASLELD
jgi:hypothetical protein